MDKNSDNTGSNVLTNFTKAHLDELKRQFTNQIKILANKNMKLKEELRAVRAELRAIKGEDEVEVKNESESSSEVDGESEEE